MLMRLAYTGISLSGEGRAILRELTRISDKASLRAMRPLAILLAPALCACAPASGPKAGAGYPEPVDTPYAFEVALTLTPRTIEKLTTASEMITVAGMYWGEPSETAKPRADTMGQINLGRDDINVQPVSRTVLLPGAAIDPKVVEADIAGAPQVLVNVFTARMAHQDNLINCGVYEGPISMAQAKPVEIKCDLLEPPVEEPAPAQPN